MRYPVAPTQIRELRRFWNIDQTAFAAFITSKLRESDPERPPVSISTVSRWETGKNVPIPEVRRILWSLCNHIRKSRGDAPLPEAGHPEGWRPSAWR